MANLALQLEDIAKKLLGYGGQEIQLILYCKTSQNRVKIMIPYRYREGDMPLALLKAYAGYSPYIPMDSLEHHPVDCHFDEETSILVMITDSKGEVIYKNPHAAQLLPEVSIDELFKLV